MTVQCYICFALLPASYFKQNLEITQYILLTPWSFKLGLEWNDCKIISLLAPFYTHLYELLISSPFKIFSLTFFLEVFSLVGRIIWNCFYYHFCYMFWEFCLAYCILEAIYMYVFREITWFIFHLLYGNLLLVSRNTPLLTQFLKLTSV